MDKRIKKKRINYKKNIAITLGDPGGIGPEILLKSIDDEILLKSNIVVIGIIDVIEKAAKLVNFNKNFNIIKNFDEIKEDCVNIFNIELPSHNFTYCSTSKINGYAAYKFIEVAINLAMNKIVDAIVTCPISKKGLNLASINFKGHTEILAEFSGTKKYRMMFVNDKIKIILHTIHIPLKDIPYNINKSKIIDTIDIGYSFLKKRFDIISPKIYVSGLNPHAGEDGVIGVEEINEIKPAIEDMQNKGIKVFGPFPPDTIFFKGLNDKVDLIVSMFHDQGLAPLKTLDFFGTVNITAGLPFIRTSPDHGTGFDIAWKNIADPTSMRKALEYAIILKNNLT